MTRKMSGAYQNESQNNFFGTDELEATEVLAFYNADIVQKMLSHTGNGTDHLKTLDFGAGIGTLAKIWEEKTGQKPVCCEIDPKQRSVIQSRGFKAISSLEESTELFDVVYSSNVLEHIEDDARIMKDLASRLLPGGFLIIYVPALPLLFSSMDERIGHFRRYTRKRLKQISSIPGMEISELYYNDFLGVFASLAVKFVGYKNKASLGSQKSLRIYDKFIYPISKFIDNLGARRIIGKNLMLVIKRIN